MRVLTIAVALALTLAGAGCGGGDDEASGDTETVATETLDTTTDETTTDETTTEETTTDGASGGFLSDDCQELLSASAALSQAFGAAGTDSEIGAAERFAEIADEAPEEVRADLQIMAEAYDAYAAAARDAGFEPGETPSADQIVAFQQALASIDIQRYSEASARFSAWATANC